MSDIPIKLDFFKKLELYQEIRYQNEKLKRRNQNELNLWEREKEILVWAARGHHKLGRCLDHATICREVYNPLFERIKSELKINGKIENPDDNQVSQCVQSGLGSIPGIGSLTEVITNLIEREYTKVNGCGNGVKITKLGMLMGQVIYDYEYKNNNILSTKDEKKEIEKRWHKWKYEIFIKFTWATVILGGILVIIEVISHLKIICLLII